MSPPNERMFHSTAFESVEHFPAIDHPPSPPRHVRLLEGSPAANQKRAEPVPWPRSHGGVFLLDDQHGIPIAEETVPFFHRRLVSAADQCIPSKGSHEHEQGRFW